MKTGWHDLGINKPRLPIMHQAGVSSHIQYRLRDQAADQQLWLTKP
ncbi:MAG: hypothetical protein OXC41_08785 [Gammaproteobacteria bacterium]|nr:hypothetical protein [Gammaproteobacteria bacterium]